ncbi:MAG: hypothetical protein KIT33_15535 [Candidatus Kapabacteria bacterium]|nr:hypothetical protein [Ignavibacteriota bacterium]MCW5886382.1 hypothetical protein [Candidatus Kapabacteria bacterium]
MNLFFDDVEPVVITPKIKESKPEIKSLTQEEKLQNRANAILKLEEYREAYDVLKETQGVNMEMLGNLEQKIKELELIAGNTDENKSLHSRVIIAEEIGDTKNADERKKWIDYFAEDEILKECDLLDRMLLKAGLEENPANLTLMLNELFKAEYEGYISNTSEIRASNHIYKVA